MVRFLKGAGTIEELVKADAAAASVGPITVTPVATQLCEVDVGQVLVGDVLLVSWRFGMTKGGVAGRTNWTINRRAGSPAVIFHGPAFPDFIQELASQAAGTGPTHDGVAIFYVSTSGALVMELTAGSAGSNGTVATDQAGMRVQVLRG